MDSTSFSNSLTVPEAKLTPLFLEYCNKNNIRLSTPQELEEVDESKISEQQSQIDSIHSIMLCIDKGQRRPYLSFSGVFLAFVTLCYDEKLALFATKLLLKNQFSPNADVNAKLTVFGQLLEKENRHRIIKLLLRNGAKIPDKLSPTGQKNLQRAQYDLDYNSSCED